MWNIDRVRKIKRTNGERKVDQEIHCLRNIGRDRIKESSDSNMIWLSLTRRIPWGYKRLRKATEMNIEHRYNRNNKELPGRMKLEVVATKGRFFICRKGPRIHRQVVWSDVCRARGQGFNLTPFKMFYFSSMFKWCGKPENLLIKSCLVLTH